MGKIINPSTPAQCLKSGESCTPATAFLCCSRTCDASPLSITPGKCTNVKQPPIVPPGGNSKDNGCKASINPSSGEFIYTFFHITIEASGPSVNGHVQSSSVAPRYTVTNTSDGSVREILGQELKNYTNGNKIEYSDTLGAGTYSLYIQGFDGNGNLTQSCTTNQIVVSNQSPQNYVCTITTDPAITASGLAKGTKIAIKIENLRPNTKYNVDLAGGSGPNDHTSDSQGTIIIPYTAAKDGITIHVVTQENYDNFKKGERVCADKNIALDPNTTGFGGSNEPNSPPPPCSGTRNADGTCAEIATGLGINISTNPNDLVKSVFGIVLSMSGGIAWLLIIVAGYQLMLARGNPEKIQSAKDRLTSAIIGLLFIIFSLVILQIIGVDILAIPGFKP